MIPRTVHRVQEFLIAADGSEISWAALNMHDDTFGNVRQFQFRQDTPGRALLRIVPAAGFSPEDEGRIRASLDRKLNGRLRLEIQCVEDIPLTARGKAVYIDQRIPPTENADRWAEDSRISGIGAATRIGEHQE